MSLPGPIEKGSCESGVQLLWDQWSLERTVSARNEIFEFYFPWCRQVASSLFLKYHHHMVDWRDFVNSASIALIVSIENFDHFREVPFEAYAYQSLKGEVLKSIKCYIKDRNADAVNSPELVSNERIDVSEIAEDSFSAVVSSAIGLAFGMFLELGVVEASDGEDLPHKLYEHEDVSRRLVDLVDDLPDGERFVIKSHYFQCLRFIEIGEILNISKARVSQLHFDGLDQLRELFESKG